MKLLKNNLYEIVRLYINQIGIAIFSLVLYTAIGMIDGDVSMTLKICISVFAVLFYFFLLYTVMWENGAKDAVRIESGKLELIKSKGFLMGLYANIPNLIIAFVCIFTQGMHLLTDIEVYKTVGAVMNIIMRFFSSMYIGIVQGIFVPVFSDTDFSFFMQSIAFFVLPLFAITVTHLGYVMGLKNKKIFNSPAKKQ